MSEEKTVKVEEGVPDFTLSTGVVLRPKAMPPYVYIRVATKDKPPKPPRFKVPNKDVYLDNTDDENYIKDFKQWELDQNDRMLIAMVTFGIEKIVKVPKGVERPTSDKWINKLRLAGVETEPDDPDWRQTHWILSVAAVNEEDFNTIFTGVGRLSGVPEEDVQTAAQFS
jgi:hypothetical protein